MTKISINQAAAQGIERIRLSRWANPLDHIKIDIIDGRPGLWAHLYSTMNLAFNGRDPVDQLMLKGLDDEEYEPYSGPFPDSEEYIQKSTSFEEAHRKFQ